MRVLRFSTLLSLHLIGAAACKHGGSKVQQTESASLQPVTSFPAYQIKDWTMSVEGHSAFVLVYSPLKDPDGSTIYQVMQINKKGSAESIWYNVFANNAQTIAVNTAAEILVNAGEGVVQIGTDPIETLTPKDFQKNLKSLTFGDWSKKTLVEGKSRPLQILPTKWWPGVGNGTIRALQPVRPGVFALFHDNMLYHVDANGKILAKFSYPIGQGMLSKGHINGGLLGMVDGTAYALMNIKDGTVIGQTAVENAPQHEGVYVAGAEGFSIIPAEIKMAINESIATVSEVVTYKEVSHGTHNYIFGHVTALQVFDHKTKKVGKSVKIPVGIAHDYGPQTRHLSIASEGRLVAVIGGTSGIENEKFVSHERVFVFELTPTSELKLLYEKDFIAENSTRPMIQDGKLILGFNKVNGVAGEGALRIIDLKTGELKRELPLSYDITDVIGPFNDNSVFVSVMKPESTVIEFIKLPY